MEQDPHAAAAQTTRPPVTPSREDGLSGAGPTQPDPEHVLEDQPIAGRAAAQRWDQRPGSGSGTAGDDTVLESSQTLTSANDQGAGR